MPKRVLCPDAQGGDVAPSDDFAGFRSRQPSVDFSDCSVFIRLLPEDDTLVSHTTWSTMYGASLLLVPSSHFAATVVVTPLRLASVRAGGRCFGCTRCSTCRMHPRVWLASPRTQVRPCCPSPPPGAAVATVRLV